MVARVKDMPFIEWALSEGYGYYYTTESGLPAECLKLNTGALTAYIHEGKLIHLTASTGGHLIDQMMCDFARLFAVCAQHEAYLDQNACAVPG